MTALLPNPQHENIDEDRVILRQPCCKYWIQETK